MAGSKKDTFENALLLLLFNNTTIAGIGSGLPAAVTAGSLYVALYTVAPGEGTAGTECNYVGYARLAVARSGAGWQVAASNASNAAALTFGACTSGTNTAVAFWKRQ